MNKKIVFFGPFIGEFGWELIYWQGWVRRLCQEKYKNYHKIACSFPGRNPFYPYVDEFWPLPEEFLKEPISSRAYITDNWINGLPTADDKKINLEEVYPKMIKILEFFQNKLPKDTVYFIPWEEIEDPLDGKSYGTFISVNPKSNSDFNTKLIPYNKQILENINPTKKGVEELLKIVHPTKKILAIFPRCRLARRPDKNWSKSKYEELIFKLQQEFPQYKIAIFGAPGGAYFTEGAPTGCLDLINLSPNLRMDIQLSALKQSVLTIGGESGGMIFALAAGCPALCWGHLSYAHNFKKENYMKTPSYFYPKNNPSVEEVMKYIRWLLKNNKAPVINIIKSKSLIIIYNFIPKIIRKFIFELNKLNKTTNN